MSANEPVFSVGSLVRVRWGARSSVCPDLPLGGWTGTVCGVDEEQRFLRWSDATLEAIDPFYRTRVETGMWLPATGLEADPGEPLAVEQFKEEDHARSQ